LPASRYYVGSVLLVLVFAALGYFGVLGVLDTHNSSADLPQGWSGAFIGAGVALFAIVFSYVSVRRRRRRRAA
jgi:TRAP-type C4-dicarboxylate transport system permease small subunit